MIKIRHTIYYEIKMQSDKLKYSTSSGLYCTTHDFKVPFYMPKLSSSKMIDHHFHVNNNKGESRICYDVIIGCDLMVKLGLTENFKRQLLQWDGATVPMNEPRSLLWKSDNTRKIARRH